MSEITIKIKGGKGKRIRTAGTYCANDIIVDTETITLTITGNILSGHPLEVPAIVDDNIRTIRIDKNGESTVIKNSIITIDPKKYNFSIKNTETGEDITSLNSETGEYLLDRNTTVNIEGSVPRIEAVAILPHVSTEIDSKPTYLCQLYGAMGYDAWVGIFKHGVSFAEGNIDCWGYVASGGRHNLNELDSNYTPVQGIYFLVNDSLFTDGVAKFESGQQYDIILFADQTQDKEIARTVIQPL